MNVKQTALDRLNKLPDGEQKKVLDFVDSLQQKIRHEKRLRFSMVFGWILELK